MKVQSLGAVGTVTGSRHLVTEGETRVLVDCGMFQGVKALRERNWRPFAFAPVSVDAVVLTHAHIDHSGMLPALVRDGFRGPIYCTRGTRDLCKVMLADAARLQEEDAAFANKKGFTKHHPAQPLYTEEDAERALRLFEPVNLHEEVLVDDMSITLSGASHILGAASALLKTAEGSVLVSGDLGRPDDPLLLPPEPPPPADLVLMESTYGDRLHGDADVPGVLADLVTRAAERRGVLLIPSFAVGRAQSLLYHLSKLMAAGRAPRLPMFLNSPMAARATEIFVRHVGDHRLSPEECQAAFDDVTVVNTVEESKELNRRGGPMVVVSASGMLTGGRVLHHLKAYGPDPRSIILLPGYQAAGTRGARLAAGERSIKVHGEYIDVRAEVVQLTGLSAHADQHELITWLGQQRERPRAVRLVHGEPAASDELRRRIAERLHLPARVMEEGEEIDVGKLPAAPS